MSNYASHNLRVVICVSHLKGVWRKREIVHGAVLGSFFKMCFRCRRFLSGCFSCTKLLFMSSSPCVHVLQHLRSLRLLSTLILGTRVPMNTGTFHSGRSWEKIRTSTTAFKVTSL